MPWGGFDEILPLPATVAENGSGHHQGQEAGQSDLGITAILKPFRWWTNQKRNAKRATEYESTAGWRWSAPARRLSGGPDPLNADRNGSGVNGDVMLIEIRFSTFKLSDRH